MSSHITGRRVRRLSTLLSSAAALVVLAAGSLAATTFGAPAVANACPVGQVGGNNGCVPYCLDGSLLDTQSGSCVAPAAAPLPPQEPAPPPPPPPPPAWNGDLTPYFSVCAGIPTPIPFVGFNACI
jgi:hypothetical protein